MHIVSGNIIFRKNLQNSHISTKKCSFNTEWNAFLHMQVKIPKKYTPFDTVLNSFCINCTNIHQVCSSVCVLANDLHAAGDIVDYVIEQLFIFFHCPLKFTIFFVFFSRRISFWSLSIFSVFSLQLLAITFQATQNKYRWRYNTRRIDCFYNTSYSSERTNERTI